MNKRLIAIIILIIYIAILINVVVFKNIPTIHIGHMMFRFGGRETIHPANFVPFKNILSYLLDKHGMIIGFINIAGNIIPFIPVGLLIPFVYKNVTWQKVVLIALALTLVFELTEVVFHIGIFDIDDIILNTFGVLIGYWVWKLFATI